MFPLPYNCSAILHHQYIHHMLFYKSYHYSIVDRRRVFAAFVVEIPCEECKGTCCTGHRGVLLEDGSILPFVNDCCPHLSDAGGCMIYMTRPRGCRAFDCSHEPGYLRSNPRIATLLTVNGIPFVRIPVH